MGVFQTSCLWVVGHCFDLLFVDDHAKAFVTIFSVEIWRDMEVEKPLVFAVSEFWVMVVVTLINGALFCGQQQPTGIFPFPCSFDHRICNGLALHFGNATESRISHGLHDWAGDGNVHSLRCDPYNGF